MKTVYIPITQNDKTPYKGWINGSPFTVPRGEMVSLPDDQAEVVNNSLKQDGIAILNLDKAEKAFAADVETYKPAKGK